MGASPQLSGWDSDYPLFIDNLVKQGFIKSRAFSLDIRSLESERGREPLPIPLYKHLAR